MTAVGEMVVHDLRRRGIRLSVKGDRLVVDAPKGALTRGDRDVLLRQKRTIVEMLVADRQADRPRVVCYACKETVFWRSVHGAVVCNVCHPPASPSLVAEWLDSSHETSQ